MTFVAQGVILYGEPGTGKTLLAKAVANSTSATFLRVVGSELIQKYLGDGPKLVRELFKVAANLSPTIVFIGGSLVSRVGSGVAPYRGFQAVLNESRCAATSRVRHLPCISSRHSRPGLGLSRLAFCPAWLL